MFAGRAGGVHASEAGVRALGHAARADVVDGAQAVFLVAAPLALLALLVVLRLPELALRTEAGR